MQIYNCFDELSKSIDELINNSVELYVNILVRRGTQQLLCFGIFVLMSSKSLGICRLSAIPGRKEASDASEMITQLIYGEQYEVVEEQEKWLFIRSLEDGYECYIDKKQHHALDRPGAAQVVTCSALAKMNQPRLLIPGGSMLYSSSEIGEYKGRSNADGPFVIEDLASSYINAPYVWGGKTILGIDCSGYMQVVFRMAGVQLPRDAWQQEEQGRAVTLEECATGDMAFFTNPKGRVTHVGLVVWDQGKRKILHASGFVRMDLLTEEGIITPDTKERTHSLYSIKRVLAVN